MALSSSLVFGRFTRHKYSCTAFRFPPLQQHASGRTCSRTRHRPSLNHVRLTANPMNRQATHSIATTFPSDPVQPARLVRSVAPERRIGTSARGVSGGERRRLSVACAMAGDGPSAASLSSGPLPRARVGVPARTGVRACLAAPPMMSTYENAMRAVFGDEICFCVGVGRRPRRALSSNLSRACLC